MPRNQSPERIKAFCVTCHYSRTYWTLTRHQTWAKNVEFDMNVESWRSKLLKFRGRPRTDLTTFFWSGKVAGRRQSQKVDCFFDSVSIKSLWSDQLTDTFVEVFIEIGCSCESGEKLSSDSSTWRLHCFWNKKKIEKIEIVFSQLALLCSEGIFN